MSTRAVFTFKDKREREQYFGTEFSVYKHHDGYPRGAYEAIKNALPWAWELPRFEACEFSAAFVAGNKPEPKLAHESGAYYRQGGDIYLTKKWENHVDLEYRYEIELQDEKLFIRAFKVCSLNCRLIFEGDLNEFRDYVKNEENR